MRTKGYNQNITVNNFNISYDDLGEGATPVIFLHGFPFNKTMWQSQLFSLQTITRVIALDIRGFGASKDEDTSLSIGLFADDLIKFMNALCIDKAIICGLSMGGYIALNAVQRFSSRFSGLILCNTQCSADTKEGKEKRYKAIEDIDANGVTPFNEQFVNSIFYKGSFLNKKETVEAVRGMIFSNSKKSIQMGLSALADRSEACSSLQAVNIPTLIICGREDAVIPMKQSEYMHSVIKGSTLRIINHAGHVSNLEHPLEFNKHLFDFISAMNTDDHLNVNKYERNTKSTVVWDI
ncbi:alpha/beta fold hydrolase [Cytophaga aurantiaca]|uniref:alpha/beta fold hydrolase n=1 Tax=Cytophaga aurantiaca TaxID=29530 RepID=UPI00037268F7|nr:alpha/beta hydrolase [Cytophaga aurantiaca]